MSDVDPVDRRQPSVTFGPPAEHKIDAIGATGLT
jgi:hypothetical protein